MILDHIGFSVTDITLSRAFFTQALAPLGIGIVSEGEGWAMMGKHGKGQFWMDAFGSSPGPIHIAFAAENREQVQAFHAAALAAGGQDNGPPGIRAQYHPNYYGAFIIGPDGHNIEAVCHQAEVLHSP
jgi:catechol 2,3-dioxygenase-like lactoylglutathione lyase family enzyme